MIKHFPKSSLKKLIIIIKKLLFFLIEHESHAISSIEIFKDNPILGVGPKKFRFECGKEKYNISKFSCSTHPHNFYIQLLAETGIVGSIIPLILLFYIILFLQKIYITKFLIS